MCTLQKAAYLGFKAGNPSPTVGWNVYADAPDAIGAVLILRSEADASLRTPQKIVIYLTNVTMRGLTPSSEFCASRRRYGETAGGGEASGDKMTLVS